MSSAQFYDQNGELRLDGSLQGVLPSIFARVSISAPIIDWDGTALPFDTVDTDIDGLWDAVNHQFVAKSPGWYEVGAYGAGSSGGIQIPSNYGAADYNLLGVVYGAGNNVTLKLSKAAAGVSLYYPPLFGHTHLDAGDGVDLENAGFANVPAGFAFSLRLIAA